MKSLIFDFGGIEPTAEKEYIRQMVEIKVRTISFSLMQAYCIDKPQVSKS